MSKQKSQGDRNRNDRGNKRDDRREIQPLNEEELNEKTKKAFNKYVAHKQRELNKEEDEEEEESTKKEDKAFDMNEFVKF